MFWIDFGGCDRSSRTTSTTLRPSRPPAALISSAAMATALICLRQ